MGGRASRRKGSNGEREFFDLCNVMLDGTSWPFRNKEGRVFFRHPATRAGKGQADNSDPLGVIPVAIEVKRRETVRLTSWIDQAISQARENQTPVVAWRTNNTPWNILAVMDLDEWGEYLRWKMQRKLREIANGNTTD